MVEWLIHRWIFVSFDLRTNRYVIKPAALSQEAMDAGLKYDMTIELSAHVFGFKPLSEEFFQTRDVEREGEWQVRKVDKLGRHFVYYKISDEGNYTLVDSEPIEDYEVRSAICRDQGKCSLNGLRGVIFCETTGYTWIRCKRQKLLFKVPSRIIKKRK